MTATGAFERRDEGGVAAAAAIHAPSERAPAREGRAKLTRTIGPERSERPQKDTHLDGWATVRCNST